MSVENTSTKAQLGSSSAESEHELAEAIYSVQNWTDARWLAKKLWPSLQPATPVEAARASNSAERDERPLWYQFDDLIKPLMAQCGHPHSLSIYEAMKELAWAAHKIGDRGVAQPTKEAAQLALAEMFSHSAINEAMQDAWNDICSDTGCHPLDIEHGRGRQLTFNPNHWANQIAKRLFLHAVKVQLEADAGASALSSTDRAKPGWSAVQFWEYVEGLTDAHVMGQIRDMLSSQGLSVSRPHREAP